MSSSPPPQPTKGNAGVSHPGQSGHLSRPGVNTPPASTVSNTAVNTFNFFGQPGGNYRFNLNVNDGQGRQIANPHNDVVVHHLASMDQNMRRMNARVDNALRIFKKFN